VEQILVLNQGVADCAVVAVPSELGDDDAMACVVLSGGTRFDSRGFYEWAAEQLPHYMVPRYVQIVDQIPRSHSGKIEKYKLRASGPTPETWDAMAAGVRASRHGIVPAEKAVPA
jgi:carnitine-CoA ligase